jgi:response regulator of citrate/malate metabolism
MYESYIEHCKSYWESQTSIDRIDNSKNYNKENCRWATCTEQNKNRTITNHINIDWKDYTAWDVAKETWISRIQASWRISWAIAWKQTKKSVLKRK